MTRAESRLKFQPKYKIGQMVKVMIETSDKTSGLTFKNEVVAIISEIKASGTSESDTYNYGITTDLPGCYYNGQAPFIFIEESEIVLA